MNKSKSFCGFKEYLRHQLHVADAIVKTPNLTPALELSGRALKDRVNANWINTAMQTTNPRRPHLSL